MFDLFVEFYEKVIEEEKTHREYLYCRFFKRWTHTITHTKKPHDFCCYYNWRLIELIRALSILIYIIDRYTPNEPRRRRSEKWLPTKTSFFRFYYNAVSEKEYEIKRNFEFIASERDKVEKKWWYQDSEPGDSKSEREKHWMN